MPGHEGNITMTVHEVAEYLKVNPKTVYRLVVRDGRLPGFKVAGSWRFRRADIDGWIDDQKKAAANGGGAC